MRFFLNFLTLLTGGALGYGVFAFATSSRVLNHFTSAAQARGAHQSSEANASELRQVINAAVNESGAALKERLAANFKLLGIDASWADALAADSATEFPNLAEKLPLLNSTRPTFLELMFLDRWAQLDPEGAAAYFKGKLETSSGTPAAEDALANFIRQWGLIDFEKAAEKATELGQTATRRTLREKAKTDPAGFLAWSSEHPEINPILTFISPNRENAMAIGNLAELDLDRVLGWAKKAPVSRWGPVLGPTLAEKLARRDPEEAIAWAKGLGHQEATTAALAGVAKALVETDPTRTLSLLKEMDGLDEFNLLGTYREIIEKLGLSDPDRALAAVRELPTGALRNQVLSQALDTLMANDPEKALALAATLGPATDETVNLTTAPKTPAEARRLLDLATKAGPSTLQTQAATSSLMAWAQADQRGLTEYLNGKADDATFKRIKDQFAAAFAMEMGQTPQALEPGLAQALGLKPESVIGITAQRNPEAAAGQLENVADTNARLALVNQIARRWSDRERSDAIDWAGTLTSPDEQAAAYRSIASGWMTEDSYRASTWISELPTGKPRDAAVLAMAQQVATTDPELSWQWAITMTDPGLRNEALARTAQHWSRLDGAALDTALASPALTDADRSEITKAMALPLQLREPE